MDRPADSQTPETAKTGRAAPGSTSPLSAKTYYLILYNFVSAALWLIVLGRVISTTALKGTSDVFYDVGLFTKGTQTLAVLEIVHSLSGLFIVLERLEADADSIPKASYVHQSLRH